jgi:hypothetical protein
MHRKNQNKHTRTPNVSQQLSSKQQIQGEMNMHAHADVCVRVCCFGETNVPSSFCTSAQEGAITVQLAFPTADKIRLQ